MGSVKDRMAFFRKAAEEEQKAKAKQFVHRAPSAPTPVNRFKATTPPSQTGSTAVNSSTSATTPTSPTEKVSLKKAPDPNKTYVRIDFFRCFFAIFIACIYSSLLFCYRLRKKKERLSSIRGTHVHVHVIPAKLRASQPRSQGERERTLGTRLPPSLPPSNAPSHWWEIHSWSSKAYYLIDIFHDVISFIYSPRDLKKKPQLKRQMSVSSLILTWCKDVTQEYEVNYSFSNYQVIDYSLSLWCTLLEPIPEVRLRENLKRRKKTTTTPHFE